MVQRLGPKKKRTLDRVRVLIDHEAVARGEPGLTHSFVASLATAIDYAGYVVDPTHLMGSSGFAFRIWVQDRLLPNSMNGFDWETILPEAVHQSGFHCIHIHRCEQEMMCEEERRLAAHEAIVKSIDQGVPAIAWDVSDPPMWGLITGYNDHTQIYHTKAFWGYDMPLDYSQLGRRDVNRLSVILLGDPIECENEFIDRSVLLSALNHSKGKEGRQLSDVRSGLAAFDYWAHLLEPGTLAAHELQFADYIAEMFFSFRCYAREYLQSIAGGNEQLLAAADAYSRVSDVLREICQVFQAIKTPLTDVLSHLSTQIRRAKAFEEEALGHIDAFVNFRHSL